MNREAMERWIEELESTDIPQTFDQLTDDDGNHCALGICGRLLGYSVEDMTGDYAARAYVYNEIYEYLGMSTTPQIDIEDVARYVPVDVANDKYKIPFWDIAQGLRAKYLKENT